MEKKRPLLSVRPYFDSGLTMVQAAICAAVGFLPVTIVGGIVVYFLFMILGLARFVPASGVFGFFLVVSLAGLPPAFYEIKKRAMQRTLFNFYDDYIDFQYFHFYINRRRGRVRYRDISDINQHASALQEQRRLTTIYLYVPGMSYQRGFSGLKLEDLQQSRGYLTKIMDVVENSFLEPQPVWDTPIQAPLAPIPMPAAAQAEVVAPAQTVPPAQAMPAQSMPAQAMPAQQMPTQPISGQAPLPLQAAPQAELPLAPAGTIPPKS